MQNSKPVLETAFAHRSVRRFTAAPINADVLDTLIRAGQAASTSSFMQNVSVIRVTDPALRAQIRSICAAGGKTGHGYVEHCAEFLVFCADTARHKQLAPDAQTDWLEVLLVGAVDVGIFAQNVLLAAESMGLGGVFIGSIRNNIAEISRLLGLPQGVVPITGMCLGYPDQDPAMRPRLPLHTVVSENAYRPAAEADLHAYNDTVHTYYRERSGTDLDWVRQIRANLCREVRPDLLAAVQAQGFAKR